MKRILFSLLYVVCMGISLMGNTASANDETNAFRETFERSWPETDFSKHTVPRHEFLSGGPTKDGIPAIDVPHVETLRDGVASGWARQLSPNAPVIVVTFNGETRAYPLEILLWHEIVNDSVGGVPIVVTYCPLCNVALVFRRNVDGKLLDFGTTGLLRKSNLVMYDRQTESWWQQFDGKSIVGALTDTKLDMAPSFVESFASYVKVHPEGEILVPSDPAMRAYGRTPYAGYDTNQSPPFLNGEVDTFPLEPMEPVVVVQGLKSPVGISLAYLRDVKELELDGLRLVWRAGMASVLDRNNLRDGRDIGEVRVEYLTAATAPSESDVARFRTFAFAYRSFFPDGKIIARCVNAKGHPHADCRP